MPELIYINRQLSIPYEELRWRFSRSSGPGGQNVNRTATRVELVFDVPNSPSLTAEQRAVIRVRLAAFLDSDGLLHVSAQSERSQWQNRQEAVDKFTELLHWALAERARRTATRIPRASRERRLRDKRHQQARRIQRHVPSDD